ncbi:MAG: PIN domain-containing protein [Deltaproteobacteria bacterium]|nr:PIN domain-containing protein [Deltaproteobacteria bacterium]
MDKFIVDSSIWIDFFKGRLPDAVSEGLAAGLKNDQAVVTDIIVHELLVGAGSKKDYQELKNLFSALPLLRIEIQSLEDFNLFGWNLAKKGLLGKYTDLTMAYLSHLHRYPLLSLDGYFHRLGERGIIQVIRF